MHLSGLNTNALSITVPHSTFLFMLIILKKRPNAAQPPTPVQRSWILKDFHHFRDIALLNHEAPEQAHVFMHIDELPAHASVPFNHESIGASIFFILDERDIRSLLIPVPCGPAKRGLRAAECGHVMPEDI